MTLVIRFAVLLLSAWALALAASPREEGIAAFQQGRYSEALPKLKDAVKNPSDTSAAIFLGLTEAALGNCKDALPALAHVESKDPALVRLSQLAVSKCYSASGDIAKAASVLQILQNRFPNDPDILYAIAKLHMKAFNNTTLAMFQRTPSSYRVHELSAEIFEVEDRYSDAITEYRKAIELNPNAPELHYRLGRAMLLESHSADALATATSEFQSELKLSPEDSSCEFQLGQIAQVQGDTAAAKSHFERALQLSPNFVQALISMGKLSVQEKQYADAIEFLKRAISIQPENESAHYALLTAYRNAGQMQEAKAEKATLDRLQKPPEGEFSDFLKKLGEKPSQQ